MRVVGAIKFVTTSKGLVNSFHHIKGLMNSFYHINGNFAWCPPFSLEIM